jgi:hypothetical protein
MDEDIVVHRFPTLSDPTDWFEIAMRGSEPVYVQRRHTIWAETLHEPDTHMSDRVARYIAISRETQSAEGQEGINELPTEPARRLFVHKPV